MTMALSSYWASILSWLASPTTTSTNTSGSSLRAKNRPREQTQTLFGTKKEVDAKALALPKTDSESLTSRTNIDFEYEMYDFNEADAYNGEARLRHKAGAHARSKSEGCYAGGSTSRQRPRESAYHTLPRSRAQHRHQAHTSSYTPVVVIPGVVNSSFMLFSPSPPAKPVPVRRRMQTFSESSSRSDSSAEPAPYLDSHIAKKERRNRVREYNCDQARDRVQGEESDEASSVSEEGEGSSSLSNSRSSFDSSDSSDSHGSYTSYASSQQSSNQSNVDDGACMLSHRAPYTISDR